jgi:hypothetical protein
MKFAKKWMVVPFEEAEPSHIENLLKNNNITNNEKVNFYNEIEIKKLQNESGNRTLKEDFNNKFEEKSNNETKIYNYEDNKDEIINSYVNDDVMDVDTTIYDNQYEIKNTIKKKLENTKKIEEKNLLNSLLKDIEINQKLFAKGYDEKIVLPVYKNTRKKNLERKKINYQFNDSVFDDEVDNETNDHPIKFNLDIPNKWEFLDTKNNTKILNKKKNLVKKKKVIKDITKKNLGNKKLSQRNSSILNDQSKKESDANSSIFLHNIKSKKVNPSFNSKILNIPEVQSLINNEIKKKNNKKESKST